MNQRHPTSPGHHSPALADPGAPKQRWPGESLLESIAWLAPLPTRELHTGALLWPSNGPAEPSCPNGRSSFQTAVIQPGGQVRIVGVHLRSDWRGREAMRIDGDGVAQAALRTRLATVHSAMQQALGHPAAHDFPLDRQAQPMRLARLLQRWRLVLAMHGVSGSVIPMLPGEAEIARLWRTSVGAARGAIAGLMQTGQLRWMGDGRQAVEIGDEAAWSAHLHALPPHRPHPPAQAAVTCATRM